MKSNPAKFISQSKNYKQHYGYPLWCAHVLDKLFATPPKDTAHLLENTARYMRDKADPEFTRIYKEGCKVLKIKPKLSRTNNAGKTTWEEWDHIFGPANADEFGKWGSCDRTPIGPGRASKHRAQIVSPGYRGYFNAIEHNQPDWLATDHSIPISFTYPIPGTNRHLQLMQIVRDSDFFPDSPESIATANNNTLNDYISYKHPINQYTIQDLLACLNPLYHTIYGLQSTLDQKTDAYITFYWIVAQATPVDRGGSAYSRIILEYITQSIGIELPHLKPGLDLWAEAVSSSLESFMKSFKQDKFFDREVTTESILSWHATQLKDRSSSLSMQ